MRFSLLKTSHAVDDLHSVSVEVDLSFADLLERICEKFEVSVEQLRGQEKTKSVVVDGRSVLSYACRYIADGSLGEVCRSLGKHHGTVSKLAKRAENNPKLVETTLNDS